MKKGTWVAGLVLAGLGILWWREHQNAERILYWVDQFQEARSAAIAAQTALQKAQKAHAEEIAKRDEAIAILQGAVDSHVDIAYKASARVLELKEREKQLIASGASDKAIILNLREQNLTLQHEAFSWQHAYAGQVQITEEWIGKYNSLDKTYREALVVIETQHRAITACNELSKEAGKVVRRQKWGTIGAGILGLVVGALL